MSARTDKLKIINRLLAPFNSTTGAVATDVLDAWELALRDIPAEFCAMALERFLSGKVPGYNASFAPTPPQFATEARDHWYADLDDKRRQREDEERKKALPRPDGLIVHTPESRARISALLKQFQGTVNTMLTPDAARAKAQQEKTDALFKPDDDPEATLARLGFVQPKAKDEEA